MSVGRTPVMDVPEGQTVRLVTPDGSVVTDRREDGVVSFTLRDPERGTATELPFRASASAAMGRRALEMGVDGRYLWFTDVRDPDFAVYDRRTDEVRRFAHPEPVLSWTFLFLP